MCFEPGDVLNVYGDAAVTIVSLWVSGAQLAGVA